MRILYQDADFLIIDKPSGLLSQPGKTIEDSVQSRMQALYPQSALVHRLDMSTSGILLVALHARAHGLLSKQFQDREVSKAYQALVYGKLPAPVGRIELPLMCDWPNRPKQMVHEDGRHGLTWWQVLAEEANLTRVRLTPSTGRSHQLRVHTSHLGFPIIGDDLYAHPAAQTAAPRLCLHAEWLKFRHPTTGRWFTCHCPCPF